MGNKEETSKKFKFYKIGVAFKKEKTQANITGK